MIKKLMYIIFSILICIFISPLNAFAVGEYGPSWEKNTLTVYIPTDSPYYQNMLHAFLKWQDKSFGQLKFEILEKQPANIEVEFVDETDGTDGDIGSYTLTVQGGYITKAVITICPKAAKDYKSLLYTVMLHEVGHALGLRDTNRRLGIMHSPVEASQDIISNDIVKLYRLNGWSFMNKGTFASF